LGQIYIENGPHPAVFHRFLADRHFWGKKAKFQANHQLFKIPNTTPMYLHHPPSGGDVGT